MWGNHDDSDEREALRKVENDENTGDWSHDLLAGAASAMAVKEWQEKQERDGKPQDYDTAKTIIAGLAGAAVTRLAETKGMDAYDYYKAKHDAAEKAKQALANSGEYGDQTYEKQAYNSDSYGSGSGSGSGGQQRYGSSRKDSEGDDDRQKGLEGFGSGEGEGYGNRGGDNDNENSYGGGRNDNDNSYGGAGYGSGGRGDDNYNNRENARGSGYGGGDY